MKKIFSLLVLLCVVFSFAEATENGKLPSEERHEVAKKLHGRIKVVQSIHEADYSVYVSESSGWTDLRVFVADSMSMAQKPGYWYFVNDNSYDFKIRFVNSRAEADVFIVFTNSHSWVGPTNY